MARARCRKVIQDALGNAIPNAGVTVRTPNTANAISETLFADFTGVDTLTQPLTTDGQGAILFYLDAPKRVDLFVQAAGFADLTIPDVPVEPNAEDVVLLTATQELSNKTLITPTIGDLTNAQHDHADASGGGTIETGWDGSATQLTTAAPATPAQHTIYQESILYAWAYVTVSGGTPTLVSDLNVTSITDSGAGLLTVTLDRDFANTNFVPVAMGGGVKANIAEDSTARVAGAVVLESFDNSGANADPAWWNMIATGAQAA